MIPGVTVSNALNLESAIIRNPLVATPNTLMVEAIAQMTGARSPQPGETVARLAPDDDDDPWGERRTCIVVVEAGHVVGLLTERDVVCFAARQLPLDALRLGDVMAPPVATLQVAECTDGVSLLALLQRHRIRHLPLLDEQNHLVGLLTRATLQNCLILQQSAHYERLQGELNLWRQTEVCLRESEQRYSSLMDSVAVGICRVNPECQTVYVNGRYCEILGLSPELAMEGGWRQGLHSDDRERVIAAWEHVPQTNVAYPQEYRFQRPDGVTIWIHEQCVAECNGYGQLTGYVVTITDISDRKRSELTLIENDIKTRAILAALPDYLFRVDAQGVYQEVVTYQPDITLFPADVDPVGMTMSAILPEELAHQQLSYLAEALSTGQLKTYEHQLQVGDRLRDEEVRVIKSGNDEALFMIRDISDRKQAERQLHNLIEGTAATTGQDFFPALVRHIAAALRVTYAVVTELVEDELQVLAFWGNGSRPPSTAFKLTKTPCELTLQRGIFYCDCSLKQRFPDASFLTGIDAQSFLGIALYDDRGNAIGELCILNHQPIQNTPRAERILRAFAARATAELERQRACAASECLNQSLKAKVAERTAELHLVAGTATTVGQDFFPALVRHIAEALDVSYVFVAERLENDLLQVLAAWVHGTLQPYGAYPPANTPCRQTMQAGMLYFAQEVWQQFPDYQEIYGITVESYLGVALRDVNGTPTGVLCILHSQPLKDVDRAMQILQVFAARASAELERQRANTALEHLNQLLEARVEERTAELWEREQFLQTVLDTFPLNIFWKDLNSVYLGGNRNFMISAGLASLAEIQGKTDYDLPWSQAEADAYRADDRQVMQSNVPKLGILETRCQADGRQIWAETNKLPLHNLDGDVIGILGSVQDITERKAAQAVIKQQLAAIEAAIDGIGIIKDDLYVYVNQAHLNLFGYQLPEDLVGQPWRNLYGPEAVQRYDQDILPILKCDRAWYGELVAIRKDGSTFDQSISLTLMDDGLVICVCRDISDLKRAQAQLSHNALHDPLTGLPNRRLLVERLDLALHRAQRLEVYPYAVLFLDLDRFKLINDSLGHSVGDKLLVEVSKRLKQHLRNTDMVARLGGDEFVILLEDVTTVDVVIQIVERILADCHTPIVVEGHKIFTSTSIGIVMGSQDYHEATSLIRDADIAMYRAKAQENNSYKFFDAVMYAEAMGRLTLETDLRKAQTHQELMIYYQPIVNLASGDLVGVEALIRWQHPTRGLIMPDEFIPVAEETGLVVSLDSWMIDQACGQLSRWQTQFSQQRSLKISINLSVQDLHRATLLQDIDHILTSTSLSGESITLEITESMLIEDVDHTIEILTQLASRQIQISIDDFGTGYSSLSYLHRLPVHNLKIDRTFVGNMHLENRNYQVVSTIVALSKQLGFTVVAEGIGTSQHLQQLQQLGCELGQGYLFAEPLPPGEVEVLLANAPADWRI